MSTIPSWLWLAVGWTLIAAGAWAAILARGVRSSHGGRRCQKCGYNMTGIETLTCPECGRVAASELELAKRLRKRPWRVGGVTVVICGWAVMQTPGVVAHGWAAAVPGPVLAPVAPGDLSGWAQANRAPSPLPLPVGGIRTGFAIPTPSPAPSPPASGTTPPYERIDQIADALFDEVWRRLGDDSLGERLGAAYLRRVLKIKGEAKEVSMPAVWAVGASPPIPPQVATASPGSHSVTAYAFVALADKPTPAMHVTVFAVAGTTRYSLAVYDHPVAVAEPRERLMRRVQSPEIDKAVLEALAPRLVVNGPSAWVEVDDRAGHAPWDRLPYFVRVNVCLVLNGKVIGHTGFGVEPPGSASAGRIAALVAWEDGGESSARAMPAGLTFELTGDPVASADEFMRCWNTRYTNNPPDAWAGSGTVSPAMVRK